MATAFAIPLFLVSLAATLLAAGSFARRLDRLGVRLGLPEALLGLLTALAADAPELSSAIVALVKGSERVGVGVVVGSNVFNLAAMIGLSALLAGHVRLRRESLLLEGTVALAATLVTAGLIAGLIPAPVAATLLVVILAPYVTIVILGPSRAAEILRIRAPGGLRRALERAHKEPRLEPATPRAVHATELLIVPMVVLIVLGSYGMVEAALALADEWSIPDQIVGTLVLAVLTSLPNAFTGVRLGLGHRGTALVSETLNSNTINLVGGLVLPAFFVTLSPLSGLLLFDVLWLIGMTVVSLVLLARHGGGGRGMGTALVTLYAIFFAVHLAYG
jgi:cation:H+ antiporter